MRIKVKDKIYEVPPWLDEEDLEKHMRDSDWCMDFFGEDFGYVAFEPYVILEDEDGKD